MPTKKFIKKKEQVTHSCNNVSVVEEPQSLGKLENNPLLKCDLGFLCGPGVCCLKLLSLPAFPTHPP